LPFAASLCLDLLCSASFSMSAAPFDLSDITDIIRVSSKQLLPGQLIYDKNNFNLQASMSAIELGDIKMDSMHEKNKFDYKNINHNIDQMINYTVVEDMIEKKLIESLDKQPNLALSQLLLIFDDLFRCLLSYLNGNSLAHTIYTCAYLFSDHNNSATSIIQPCLTNNKYLAPFLQLLLKLFGFCRSIIVAAQVNHYEEDFISHNCNLSLLESISIESVMAAVNDAEKDLESLQSTEGQSLLLRFRLIKSFYQLLQNFFPQENKAFNSKTVHKLLNRTQQLVTQIFPTLERSNNANDSAEAAFDYLSTAFNGEITRCLFPNHPPRQFPPLSLPIAVSNFSTLLNHFHFISNYEQNISNLRDSFAFTRLFSYLDSNILVRSIYYLIVGDENSFFQRGSMQNQLREALKLFSPSVILLEHENDFLSVYFARLARPIHQLYRIYCGNTSYQRNKSIELLEDFKILQHDAGQLDQTLQQHCQLHHIPLSSHHMSVDYHLYPYAQAFFSWVFDFTVELLIIHFKAGIKQELYNSNELIFVYFYLDYLLDSKLQNIKSCHREVKHIQAIQLSINKSKTKKVTKNKANNNIKIKYSPLSSPNQSNSFLMTQIEFSLYRSLLQSLLIYKRLAVQLPHFSFDQRQYSIWFNHRFQAVLSCYSPQPRSYSSYLELESSYSTQPINNLLQLAQQQMAQAKELLSLLSTRLAEQEKIIQSAANLTEQNAMFPVFTAYSNGLNAYPLAFLRTLIRVNIHNSVQLSMINKLQTNAASNNCTVALNYSFESNWLFPQLILTSKAHEKSERQEER
jgi:hypothetical protein